MKEDKFDHNGAYNKCQSCGYQVGRIDQTKRDPETGLANECPKCGAIGHGGMVFYATPKSWQQFRSALFGRDNKTER